VGPLAAATYNATAWADDNSVIVESRETNNSLEDSFAVTGPDLIVDSLTHSPANPTTSDTITLTAIVKNIGTAQAGNSTLVLSGIPVGGPNATPALAAGASATVTRTVVIVSAGTYAVTATADGGHVIAESDETNNSKGDSFVVTALPDLIVQSLTYTPANPDEWSDIIKVQVLVKNMGIGAAGASPLRLEYYNNTDAGSYIGPISPGGQVTAQYSIGPFPASNWALTAIANDGQFIKESNYQNNLKSTVVTVAPLPDLVVTLSYECVGPGICYLQAIVTNTSPYIGAGASDLYFFCEKIGGEWWGSYTDVAPLAPHESSTKYYLIGYYSTMPKGDYIFWADADKNYQVKERSEYNNRSATIRITIK
jgi:uncharacterized repeat protein (TIGR01451 family)